MRHKTRYTGVFYRTTSRDRNDKSFYIVYKRDAKIIEEQVGREKKDKMTAKKAFWIRKEKMMLQSENHDFKKKGSSGKTRLQKGLHTKNVDKTLTAELGSLEITHPMLEYANDAVYVSQDSVTKFVNSKTEKITGYPYAQLVGQSSFYLTHPEDLKVIRDRYRKRFRGEKVSDLFPHRIIDKAGNIKWIEVSTVMITWEGRPALLNFMREITRRKMNEEALKQSEQLRTDIINFLPDPTFAIDQQGHVTAWNLAMVELTGVEAGQIIGQGGYQYAKVLYGKRRPILIDKVLHPTLSIREYSISQGGGDDSLLAETTLWHRGKKRVFWCKAGLIKDRSGKRIGAIESIRDISEFKEMNTVLDTLLKKRETDLRKSEEKIMRNINERVLPYVLKLKSGDLEFSNAVDVDIIEKNLQEITSPFLSRLSSGFTQFSPREMQVADMIRSGMTTKQIANALMVSTNAIDIYRQNIRKKLGLNKKKINLRSFLVSLGKE